MSNYIYTGGELYHYGVKGMKWGVRRYQNPDGTLTPEGKRHLAESLKNDYKRNRDSARPGLTSEEYKETVKKAFAECITDEDRKALRAARDEYRNAIEETEEARKDASRELWKLQEKYGQEAYDAEMRRRGDNYDTPRSRQKLLEYCISEAGDKARKDRPDLAKVLKSNDAKQDAARDAYREECEKAANKILGEYGDMMLYESRYYSISIRKSVGDIIDSELWMEYYR